MFDGILNVCCRAFYKHKKMTSIKLIRHYYTHSCRSQWPRGLRCRSVAARLLRLWVRIPPGAWIFVCCECCVLSGRGLCVGQIPHPEESYRVWCVWVWSWGLKREEVLAQQRLLRLRKKKHEDSANPPSVHHLTPKWCYDHNTITVRYVFVYYCK